MARRIPAGKGRGSVSADIGLPNSEEELAKAEIARLINDKLSGGTSLTEAGAILGVPQSRVSDLMQGRLDKFSLDRLLDFAVRLGNDVEIRLKPSGRPHLRVRTIAQL